jgi:UDP-N-acetylglucosamine acyltransferase
VRLGTGNTVGPYTIIDGWVEIGNGNWIGPHVVIGTPPQHSVQKLEFYGSRQHLVRIGDRNVLREFVTIHQPTEDATILEDDCYIMAYSHVAHDSVIRRGAVLANSVQTAGFSEIQEYANVGLGTVIHQYSTVGAFAMLGMGTVVTKDILPFTTVVGNPGRILGINETGLARHRFDADLISKIKAAYERGGLPANIDAEIDRLLQHFLDRNASTGRPRVSFANVRPPVAEDV